MPTYTHHVPWFTKRDAQGREQAVCLAYVTAEEVAQPETLPTCWGCAAWVDNLDYIAPEPAQKEPTV